MNRETYDLHMLRYRDDGLTLRHHGILGQKWGVRRYQNPDGSYTAAGRARYGYKEYTPNKNKKRFGLDDDIIIKANGKNMAYRVSRNEKDTGNTRYVTLDEEDNAKYASGWIENTQKKGTTAYQQTYDIKEDIKAPSLKKRIEICNELYTDKNLKECAKVVAVSLAFQSSIDGGLQQTVPGLSSLEKLNDIYNGKTKGVVKKEDGTICKNEDGTSVKYEDWQKMMKNTEKLAYENFKKIDSSDSVEKANVISSCIHGSPSLMAEYGKKIVERGYNATFDDHSVDYDKVHRVGKAPMILFDANNTLVQKGASIIDDAAKQKATRKIQKHVSNMYTGSTAGATVGLILGAAVGTAASLGTVAATGVYIPGIAYAGALSGMGIGLTASTSRTQKRLLPSISDYKYNRNLSYRNKADAQIVAAYKREHPGTKLSKDEILRNYFGGK